MIEVIQAREHEYPQVLTLVDRLLVELGDDSDEFSGLQQEKTLRDLHEAGSRFIALLACDADGAAVGVLTIVETFAIYANGRYGVIDEMYVAPEHRSAGVGAQLIATAKEIARARGWRRLDVTAPPEPRWVPTVRFYEREGFVFTGPKLRCLLPG